MIGIVGNMSGGKSYTAVSLMLQAMRNGHTVVTNIQLCTEGVTDYLGVPESVWGNLYWKIVDDDVKTLGWHEVRSSDYEAWPCGSARGTPTYENDLVYIFLDEVSSIFDSMTSGSSEKIQNVAAWARHTEKRGQLLYLIMQFENELHKRLRVHITEYIFCRNMRNVKVPFIRCRLPKAFSNFIAQIHLMPDGETPLGRPDFATLDPKIFACYRTAQIVVGSRNFVSSRPIDYPGDVDVLRSVLSFVLFSAFLVVASTVVLWLLL